jgi:hypothetical protein
MPHFFLFIFINIPNCNHFPQSGFSDWTLADLTLVVSQIYIVLPIPELASVHVLIVILGIVYHYDCLCDSYLLFLLSSCWFCYIVILYVKFRF